MKIAALKILILGGTHFLGLHLTEELVNHGHEVTLFNRGTRSIDFPVQQLQGDRDGNLEALYGHTWDVVIDTSGHVPRIVEQSAKLLAQSTSNYTFISTIGVYENFEKLGIDETYPIAQIEDVQNEEITEKNYGALKGLCEAVVHKYFPKNSLIIRPGLIVGPHDPTDRFTYWPVRISEGGEVLAPAHQTIQFIDVRDLAKWIVQMVEQQSIGIYNATGTPISFDRLLNECKRVTHSTAHINWVKDDFLIKKEVQDWSELPLWLSKKRQMPGFMQINSQKAINAGLSFCPLTETISSILQWNATREPAQLKAGLDRVKENSLLMDWRKYSSTDNQEKLVFSFAPAESSQKNLLHQWFEQKHIQEWMHGVGLQNTLNGLEKFFQGKSDTTYWIGYDNDIPFAFLITSPEGDDATTLDLFICDLNYLGKGIAVPMIREFLITHFPNMKRVLIDPEATNKRAIHVYQKVGFKIVGEFIASWHPVPHYQMELYMKDLLEAKK